MEQAQKSFAYVARDATGARQSGVVSGLDVNDATRALRAQGLFPIRLDVDDGSIVVPSGASKKSKKKDNLTQKHIADFLVRLA